MKTLLLITLLTLCFTKDKEIYQYYNTIFKELDFNVPDEIIDGIGCIKGDCDNGQGRYVYMVPMDEGEFKDGKLHGKGIRTWSNGGISEGEWKNGEMIFGSHFYGRGSFLGDVYVGEFDNQEKNGIGTYKKYNGDIYYGEWIDDLPNGKGKEILSDGTVNEGNFINGDLVKEIY